MSELAEINNAFNEGKREFKEIMERDWCPHFSMKEKYGKGGTNVIAGGDNAHYMEYLLKEEDMGGRIQLIYIDPPFCSRSKYTASVSLNSPGEEKSKTIKIEAYDDRWDGNMGNYIRILTVRLLMCQMLLKNTGCIWVHLDWHAAHYVKLVMDQIFGKENFVNEIIWTYKSGGSSKKSFARKHDTILFYSKQNKYKFHQLKEKSYNRELKPYKFKGVQEYQDDTGWYTMVNMKDVWSIDMVGRTSSERTGYASQKPEALIRRIVESCSSKGDLCADFFGGSGTFAAVCNKMDRNWITCDQGRLALADERCRLLKAGGSFVTMENESNNTLCGDVEAEAGYSGEEVTVKLRRYSLPTQELSDSQWKERNRLKSILREDNLDMIKFWSIDFDSESHVHNGEVLIFNGYEEIIIKMKNISDRHIKILGYDILGNRFTKRIPVKERGRL